MYDVINEVDLAFVVDTTSSMAGLIATAQQQMITMLREVSNAADCALQLGVVEYRDHPPQDHSLVSKAYPFTSDLEQAQKTILGLRAQGGGDGPEAVLDGIVAACHELTWRKHARRLLVLVGDAPPHGVGGSGDGFPQGCPCGEDIHSITRQAEEKRIAIHALGLTSYATEAFSEISALAGGRFFAANQAEQAIKHLATLLTQEFAELDLDRRVLARYQATPELPVEEMAKQLDVTRHAVSTSLVRLLSRDLIEVPVLPS